MASCPRNQIASLNPQDTSRLGEPLRSGFSVLLDLKRPEARAALLRLAARADVFAHNMRVDAARRLGIDYESTKAVKPDIIHAVGGGFRKGGPRGDRPAFDDVIQGMSGVAALNGKATGTPAYVPMVMVDKICGMALVHRERTGRGQEVHLPMFETMVGFNMIEHFWMGTLGEPEKGVGYPRLLTPHRRPYPTLDGHVCVMASTDSQWLRLYAVLDVPELAEDRRFRTRRGRTTHVDALYGIVADRLRQRPTAEWLTLLDAAGIPNGPPESLRRLPPCLGEHTREVPAEIGLTADEIQTATS